MVEFGVENWESSVNFIFKMTLKLRPYDSQFCNNEISNAQKSVFRLIFSKFIVGRGGRRLKDYITRGVIFN